MGTSGRRFLLAAFLALTSSCHAPSSAGTTSSAVLASLSSQGGNGSPYEGDDWIGHFFDYQNGPECSESDQVLSHAIHSASGAKIGSVDSSCDPVGEVAIPESELDRASYDVRLIGYGTKIFDLSARDLAILSLPVLQPVDVWCRWVDSSNLQGLDIVVRGSSAQVFFNLGGGDREVPSFTVSMTAGASTTYDSSAAHLVLTGTQAHLDTVIDDKPISIDLSCRTRP
jgi:hypothetical protein